VTSKKSESVNNMFKDVRNVGCRRAMETILDIMSTMISKVLMKNKGKGGHDIISS
jgi:hypothetical protein